MNQTLFGIENLKSHDVFPTQPWTQNLTLPHFNSSADYKTWLANKNTAHLLFSGFEGEIPTQRFSKGNPARRMVAAIADYDAELDPTEYQTVLLRLHGTEVPFRPNFVSRTYSGGMRLVWFFEAPALIHSASSLTKFLKRLAKELNLNGLCRGWDEKTFYDGNKYYAYGVPGTWAPVSTDTIPHNHVTLWQFETTGTADLLDYGVEIPLEKIAEAVEKKFPGRWEGPFEEGCRGSRFWDSSADSPRAAVVRRNGMQCFTGTQPFVTWAEIFGRDFVRQHMADRIGAAINSIYYDGVNYWERDENGAFQSCNTANIQRALEVDYGLSTKVQRGETVSELKRALREIEKNNRVEAALPFLFCPELLVYRNGKRYLNVSRMRPHPMAEETQEWGVNFPHTADLLVQLFGPTQLPYYLGWQHHFYRNAAEGVPYSGQALLLVGETGVGKTLFSTKLVALLMGGGVDASDHFLGDSDFNDHMYEVGVWNVDDGQGTVDQRTYDRFSAALKKAVANTTFMSNGKFKKAGMVDWRGRVVLTMNPDQKSLGLIPSLDINIRDKLMVFLSMAKKRSFPANIEALIRDELPYFARYIYDFVMPQDVKGEARYGVHEYIHPRIEELANAREDTPIVEMMDLFRQHYFQPGSVQTYCGTASQLISACPPGMNAVTKDWNAVKLGRALTRLHGKGTYDWLSCEIGDKTQKWVVRSPHAPSPVSVSGKANDPHAAVDFTTDPAPVESATGETP